MSKQAKIGLGVVLAVSIAVGGVVTWRLLPKSSAAMARADAEAKEKSHREGEFKAGKSETESAERKSRYPREGKELPNILTPSSGRPPQRENERDWRKDVSDYRASQSAGEAMAISPPPMVPEPAAADDADPNNPYRSNPGPSAAPASDLMGPPAGIAAASGERQRGDLRGNRAAKEARLRGNPLAEGVGPPDVAQPGPSLNGLHAEHRNDGPLQPGENYRGKLQDGYVPYDRGPNASFAGRERNHPGGDPYNGLKEPEYAAKNGSRGDGTYDVQPNESFSAISQKIYGTESYFKALEELNRGKSPDGQLKVGQNILAPDVTELEKRFPALCPKENHREVLQNRNATLVSAHNLRGTRSYTVVEGDTLFDIARYELGKASRWAEIYDLNQNVLGKDFDYLVPGTELALPEDKPERPDPIARRQGGRIQR